MACVCDDFPTLSVNAPIESESLWSETINFSQKFEDIKNIDDVIETITNSVKKTKTVCSEKSKDSCSETCSTVCKCGKIAGKKVCGGKACKFFGVEKACDRSCKSVIETYCEGVDVFEDVVSKSKIDVKTEVYFELKGNININVYTDTSIGAGTGGVGEGISVYLVIRLTINECNAVGKLKVKGNKVAGFSISEEPFKKIEIPPFIVGGTLSYGVDIDNLGSYNNLFDFLDAELAACVVIEQIALNYNVGRTTFTLGNPTISLCASPELRKIVLSVQGSINHTFPKIKNTDKTPNISTDFSIPLPIPLG